VIAIDLPGFGKTRVKDRKLTSDKGSYLASVIDTLTPSETPIVVSPSMSGGFIIPLLSQQPEKVKAWVPVAPVSSSQGRSFFPSLTNLPTMIVQGENDKGLGESSRRDLVLIPDSTSPQILPNSGHPAYLDQPDLWHKLLYNFLEKLS